MVSIHEAMQAAYQPADQRNGLDAEYTKAAGICPAGLVLNFI